MATRNIEFTTLELIDLELLLTMAGKEVAECQRSDNDRLKAEGERLAEVNSRLRAKIKAARK